jgi:hypothetical protein
MVCEWMTELLDWPAPFDSCELLTEWVVRQLGSRAPSYVVEALERAGIEFRAGHINIPGVPR